MKIMTLLMLLSSFASAADTCVITGGVPIGAYEVSLSCTHIDSGSVQRLINKDINISKVLNVRISEGFKLISTSAANNRIVYTLIRE